MTTGAVTPYACPLPLCGWSHQLCGSSDQPVTTGLEAPAGPYATAHTPDPAAALAEHLATHDPALWAQAVIDKQAERDQYAAASRHLARRIREVPHAWITQLPDTIRTAAVVDVLLGIASHVPDRPHLRDDLWMRIAGAYEARFLNDGHPEDARHAADEAMSVVQPVVDQLRAERDQLAKKVEALEAGYSEVAADALRHRGCHMTLGGVLNRAEDAEKRIKAVTEAVVVWRDRPGGDVGLAIALAGVLDAEQPDPPAAAALVRVLRECDRLERAVRNNPTSPDLTGGYLACLRHIRRAAAGPECEECDDTGACAGGPCAHPDTAALPGGDYTETRERRVVFTAGPDGKRVEWCVVRTWADGSRYTGPWQPCDDAETAEMERFLAEHAEPGWLS